VSYITILQRLAPWRHGNGDVAGRSESASARLQVLHPGVSHALPALRGTAERREHRHI